ncbi:helix-turn-helix domain-containing protein [Parasediminibacterium paludis]|uniref:Helix-turn-helix domain-containing protein n=1 Tax=Parasediminibacterium paludis TaxID=908966 RepID=A0ABV8PWF6_9BACT
MTTIKKTQRTSNPLIKRILSDASPLKRMQNKNRVALACRIDDLIKAKGYNNSTFAEKIGKQPSVITKWLSGTHNFTVDTLDEIAYHLGVETAYLMQPQQVQVIYQKTIQVVTKVVEVERISKYNFFRNNRYNSIGGVGHIVGMPYTSLIAKS